MLTDLPNHLGPHVASGVTNMCVEIDENVFAIVIREEGVMRGVGEGILDGLETMENT